MTLRGASPTDTDPDQRETEGAGGTDDLVDTAPPTTIPPRKASEDDPIVRIYRIIQEAYPDTELPNLVD
ncbi:MAG: hypothetical protein CMJ86_05790 [Planctomycetes bacterium]|nr:hypothetical protein [Planctomycetota bacterium]